jgi:hypothetical protein
MHMRFPAQVLSHEVDAEVLRFRGEAGERGWGEE